MHLSLSYDFDTPRWGKMSGVTRVMADGHPNAGRPQRWQDHAEQRAF